MPASEESPKSDINADERRGLVNQKFPEPRNVHAKSPPRRYAGRRRLSPELFDGLKPGEIGGPDI